MALRPSGKPKNSAVSRNGNEQRNTARERGASRNLYRAEVFEIVAHCTGPSRGGAAPAAPSMTSVSAS
jgi:hypothetical protein